MNNTPGEEPRGPAIISYSFAHNATHFDLGQFGVQGRQLELPLKRQPANTPMTKTEALSVRVSAEIKSALQKAAERDHRSLASLVVKILVEWLTARKLMPDSRSRKGTG